MKKLLDSNIILYLLGDRLAQPLSDDNYFISVISELEILSFPSFTNKEEKCAKLLLSEFTIIGLDDEIKEVAIQLRRKKLLKLPDAIIAATALAINAELYTNDTRLLRVPNLKSISLELKN